MLVSCAASIMDHLIVPSGLLLVALKLEGCGSATGSEDVFMTLPQALTFRTMERILRDVGKLQGRKDVFQ